MQEARRFGSPVIAEYGVEVNGWWFPWNGLYNKEGGSYADSVSRFREAYQHIIPSLGKKAPQHPLGLPCGPLG